MKIEFVKDDKLSETIYRHLKSRRLPSYAMGEWPRDRALKEQLTGLLRGKIKFLADSVPPDVRIVSLGVGDGEKEDILVRELGVKGECEYCAMDVRTAALDAVMSRLAGAALKKTSCTGFVEDLPKLRQVMPSPLLLCCLDNNFCTVEPGAFLSLVRANLFPQDLFLMDCHLAGAESSVTGQCEGLPAPGLAGLGFPHDGVVLCADMLSSSTPAGLAHRTKEFLRVQKDCRVSTEAGSLQLKKGEELDIGFTYRYTFTQVVTLLKRARFQIVRMFISDSNEDLVVLSRPLEDNFLGFSLPPR